MRHETCLNCIYGEDATELAVLIAVAEKISPRQHHHHAVTCKTCGRWWLDDIRLGAYGQPAAIRRGTELCGCPDDPEGCTPAIVMIPGVPEDGCTCTAAEIGMRKMQVDLGGTG